MFDTRRREFITLLGGIAVRGAPTTAGGAGGGHPNMPEAGADLVAAFRRLERKGLRRAQRDHRICLGAR
jgi:hypothetical protein